VNRLIIEKYSVCILSVLTQRLAVIGHNRDQRPVIKSTNAQLTQQFSHRGIDIRDFAIVRRGRVAGLVRLRRIIWIVCIVKMHHKKNGPRGC